MLDTSLATWAALPTSVWMRMYAVTDTAVSLGKRLQESATGIVTWRCPVDAEALEFGCDPRPVLHWRHRASTAVAQAESSHGDRPGVVEPTSEQPVTLDAVTDVRLVGVEFD